MAEHGNGDDQNTWIHRLNYIFVVYIWPSANKDSYCWGQGIPNNNFKSIEYIRLSSCIFKMIGPEENMLKISWQSDVPSRSYQQ